MKESENKKEHMVVFLKGADTEGHFKEGYFKATIPQNKLEKLLSLVAFSKEQNTKIDVTDCINISILSLDINILLNLKELQKSTKRILLCY